jgi:hypothetical protein
MPCSERPSSHRLTSPRTFFLRLRLADALLLDGEWFTNAVVLSHFVGMRHPLMNGRLSELHIASDFNSAQVLLANHLNDLQIEFCMNVLRSLLLPFLVQAVCAYRCIRGS